MNELEKFLHDQIDFYTRAKKVWHFQHSYVYDGYIAAYQSVLSAINEDGDMNMKKLFEMRNKIELDSMKQAISIIESGSDFNEGINKLKSRCEELETSYEARIKKAQ
jgi:hypothetical protein